PRKQASKPGCDSDHLPSPMEGASNNCANCCIHSGCIATTRQYGNIVRHFETPPSRVAPARWNPPRQLRLDFQSCTAFVLFAVFARLVYRWERVEVTLFAMPYRCGPAGNPADTAIRACWRAYGHPLGSEPNIRRGDEHGSVHTFNNSGEFTTYILQQPSSFLALDWSRQGNRQHGRLITSRIPRISESQQS